MTDTYMERVDRDDPEECEACNALGDLCAYHVGHDDGMRYMARVVGLACADPDAVREATGGPRGPTPFVGD